MAPETKSHTRIWLTPDLYVLVDDAGLVRNEDCTGGKLGMVIKLHSRDEGSVALKIPRLSADTLQENAYVADLLAREYATLRTLARTNAAADGLFAPEATEAQLLRGRRQLVGNDEAVGQDGCVTLISFVTGRPRFCNIKGSSEGKLEVFPSSIAAEIGELGIGRTDLERIANDGPTGIGLFVTRQSGTIDANEDVAKPLGNAFESEKGGRTWFGAPKSIRYPWASGTLQQALVEGALSGWENAKHFDLIKRLLTGVRTLHGNSVLHGDVRPANVFFRTNTTEPGNFALGDYGSFRFGLAHSQAPPGTPSGVTVVGSYLGTHRLSAFYSPERRSAVESEVANCALVMFESLKLDKPRVFVILGWRSDLLTERGPHQALYAAVTELAQRDVDPSSTAASSNAAASAGDYLRLNDYVFQIVRTHGVDVEGSTFSVYECDPRVGRVYQNRLTVYGEDLLSVGAAVGGTGQDGGSGAKAALNWLSIWVPSYFVFRQWSASTDIYGCGALALYVVFWIARRRGIAEEGRLTDADSAAIEAEFSEMMATLESQPYFRFVWTDLEVARQELAGFPGLTGIAPDEAPKVKVSLNRWFVERAQLDGVEDTTDRNYEYDTVMVVVQDTVKKLLQSVPHLKHVGAYFKWNVAYIALFMHFIVSCLHYDDHAEASLRHRVEPQSDQEKVHDAATAGKTEAIDPSFAEFLSRREHTFCTNRLVKPSGESAARALSAFQRFMDAHSSTMLVAFVSEHLQHVEFDPTPDPALRFRVQELTAENVKLATRARVLDEYAALGWVVDKLNPSPGTKRKQRG